MKLQTILHTAIFYIAVCKSLTISKKKDYRQGRLLGVTCATDAECNLEVDGATAAANNEFCDPQDLVCKCMENFVNSGGLGVCVADLDAPCIATGDECTMPNQACYEADGTTVATGAGADQTCGCRAPMFRLNPDTGDCAPTIGGGCTLAGGECVFDNQFCDTVNFFCSCSPGFMNDGGDPRTCMSTVGGPCDAVEDTCDFANQECGPADTCVCDTNFAQNEAEQCVESVGGACPLNNECILDNQECQVTATGVAAVGAGADQACACIAGFAQNDAGACVASIDGACPLGTECTLANQECQVTATGVAAVGAGVGQACACVADFEAQDGICVRSLGTACVDMMCDLDNSECAGGFCVCTAPFVDNNGDVAAGACAPTIGGPCLFGECTLVRQECQVTDTGVAAVAIAVAGQACACEAGFGADANNECVPSVGGDCSTLGTECTLDNQECQVTATMLGAVGPGAGQACACIALFAPNPAGACEASIGAPCPLGTECTLDREACDAVTDAANPVCAVSVGGDCPLGTECTLDNQECQLEDGTPGATPAAAGVAQTCGCEGGWEQNPAITGPCNAANFDFCDTVVGGCALGQGDCDEDNDCAGPLACGVNNCGPGRALADCCYDPTIVVDCDGTDGNMWACCSPAPGNQCAEGKGDCDTDFDCMEGLMCGANNCQGDAFNTDPNFPINQADCCVSTLFYNKEDLFDEEGFDKRKEWFRNDGERAQSRPKF